MGGTWWSEDLAGEAILQLDCLAIDDYLLGPGRRPVPSTAIGHILGKSERERKTKHVHKKQSEKTVKTELLGQGFLPVSLRP